MPRLPTFTAGLALAATAIAASALTAAPAPSSAARQPALPLKEFMGHVIQRNAEQVWAWTAEEVDASGTHSSQPRNEQDWENAESDALSLGALTALLDRAPYRIADAAWAPGIARVRTAAAQSAKAAEMHDYAGLLKAADAINAACVACHMHYAPELEGSPPGAVPPPA